MIRKLTLVMLLTSLLYAEDKPKPKPELDKDLKIEILLMQRKVLSDINVVNDDNSKLMSLFNTAQTICGANYHANPVTLECDEVPNAKTTPTPAPVAKPSK